MPVDMAEISLVDAIAFVESNRYLCVPLDSPDGGDALSAFSLDNVRASLAWLCVALFAFFAAGCFRYMDTLSACLGAQLPLHLGGDQYGQRVLK